MFLRAFALLAAVVFASTVARATSVLDQEHNFNSSIASSTNGNVTEVGQTFTVGVAGTLDRIEVLMFRLDGIFDPTGDAVLNVYQTAAGLPTGDSLATSIVAESLVPLGTAGFVTFDVGSAAIPVNVGDVLAFAISTPSEIGPYFLPNDSDLGQPGDYAAGTAVSRIRDPLGPWSAFTAPTDHGFRTWVTPVPEPGTFCLLSLGLAGLALVGWRRRA